MAFSQDVANIRRISVSNAGVPGNSDSINCSMSADGGIIAFESLATNLIPGLITWYSEIYVFDAATGLIDLVHVDSNEQHGGSPGAVDSSVSGDGRFVAFRSGATNLIAGDTNGTYDVFVRDLVAGTTERVSVWNGDVELNGPSAKPAVSFDGRFVAFETAATNADPLDTSTNIDVYLRDRQLATTTRVTVNAGGTGNGYDPTISGDGRYVAFNTFSPMLPADTNTEADIYLKDMTTGVLSLVSSTSAGVVGGAQSAHPSLSGDGSKIAFSSRALNLHAGISGNVFQILVKDLLTGTIDLVSQNAGGQSGTRDSFDCAMSADGLHVAFMTSSPNMTAIDLPTTRDVFVRDLALGQTVPISVSLGGVTGDNHSDRPAISADGSIIAYHSDAKTLIPQDTSGIKDVLVTYRGQPAHRSFCYSGNSIFCPCSNGGLRGRGCNHASSANGPLLIATGTPSVQADSILLEAFNLVPSTAGLVFQGTARHNGGQGATLGDGLLCASGTITRMSVRFATATGYMQLGAGVPGDPSISTLGVVDAAGGVRTYQIWYRDTGAYCTPALFNATNGIEISWSP